MCIRDRFAIVKELKKYPQIAPEDVLQINLPIGLPPKHFVDLCEKYECYFKGENKVHEIITEGGTYHVAIHDVMAFPQDYAAMMTVIDKLQDIPKSIGIDIGGFTTDYLLMRKGMPDMESCDSLERGVITMYNQVISGVNSEYDICLLYTSPQRAGHFGLRRRQRNVRWKKSIYLLPAVCDYKRSQTAEYGKSEVLSDADQTALSLSYFCIPCTSSPYVG